MSAAFGGEPVPIDSLAALAHRMRYTRVKMMIHTTSTKCQ